MASKFAEFQRVLESLQRAQACGVLAALDDQSTRDTDDQDCYPRGLRLNLDPLDPRWPSIRFLAKHLDWIRLHGRKALNISPPEAFSNRLTEIVYLNAVAGSLQKDGIDCFPDVYYR
jgi:hypothetical protein